MSAFLETLCQDFAEIRAEQRERMTRRENQGYLGMGVIGGAVLFLVAYPTLVVAGLVAVGLPTALYSLGLRSVTDDCRVSEIDDCIKRALAPAIEAELARLHPGLTYEERLAILPWYRGWRKQYPGRVRRKWLRLLEILLIFSGGSAIGPMLFLALTPLSPLSVVPVFGLVLTTLVTTEIILSAEVIPTKWLKRSKKR
jgi:hypothetical protein